MNISLTPKMQLKENVVLLNGKAIPLKKFNTAVAKQIKKKGVDNFKTDLENWKNLYNQYEDNTITNKPVAKELYAQWEHMNEKYLGNKPIELVVTVEGGWKEGEAKGLHFKLESDALSGRVHKN